MEKAGNLEAKCFRAIIKIFSIPWYSISQVSLEIVIMCQKKKKGLHGQIGWEILD